MASIVKTRPASTMSFGRILAALVVASVAINGLQAHQATFGRSKSDSSLQVKPRRNHLPVPPTVSKKSPRSVPQWSPYGGSRFSSQCSLDYNFDHLQLTLMWAPGTCSTSAQSCISSEIKPLFTIHGLWPDRNFSLSHPEDCCFQNTFVIEYLKPIMSDLEKWWPSYFTTENRFFWSHEWRKHGTCAKDIDALSGEFKYFSSTLNITKKLPILETLRKANIVPSDDKTYDSDSIVKALAQIHNRKFIQINCDYEHDQPTPLITGLNFCFDRQLKPKDCAPMKRKCSRQNLRFPATVRSLSSASKYGSRNGNNNLQPTTARPSAWSRSLSF